MVEDCHLRLRLFNSRNNVAPWDELNRTVESGQGQLLTVNLHPLPRRLYGFVESRVLISLVLHLLRVMMSKADEQPLAAGVF